MGKSNQRGSILLIALGVVSVVSLFAFLAVENIVLRHAILRNSANWQRAVRIADAGIESAIAALGDDSSFQGERDIAFDEGTFTTEVTRPGPAESIYLIRARSLFKPSRRRTYRKELLVGVRLSQNEAEILSRAERTPIR